MIYTKRAHTQTRPATVLASGSKARAPLKPLTNWQNSWLEPNVIYLATAITTATNATRAEFNLSQWIYNEERDFKEFFIIDSRLHSRLTRLNEKRMNALAKPKLNIQKRKRPEALKNPVSFELKHRQQENFNNQLNCRNKFSRSAKFYQTFFFSGKQQRLAAASVWPDGAKIRQLSCSRRFEEQPIL